MQPSRDTLLDFRWQNCPEIHGKKVQKRVDFCRFFVSHNRQQGEGLIISVAKKGEGADAFVVIYPLKMIGLQKI